MLTFLARNEALGQEAVKKLNGEGLHPKFHQLDLTDKISIDRLKNFLQSKYGGLDILVNNAGMAFKVSILKLEIDQQARSALLHRQTASGKLTHRIIPLSHEMAETGLLSSTLLL